MTSPNPVAISTSERDSSRVQADAWKTGFIVSPAYDLFFFVLSPLMALGMARRNLIGLFTVEGAFHGILALLVGAIYGIPLMILTAVKGIPYPADLADKTGLAIPVTMYPVYGMPLLVGATALVLVTVTFVSYLPTRKVSKLKPTDALKGRMP